MARYLTTTLPYVNADPHLGHALELVQADALARAWRLSGEDVFLNTGTDEHGQKIFEAAQKAGEDVQAYADRFSARFKELAEKLGLGEHAFIRTTDPRHAEAAQEMWRRCAAKGDIYKKAYEGLYCVGHEAFITEKDLVDGKCPDHDKEPERIEEENYFFKLSGYKAYLREQLSRETSVLPDWRRKELLGFVENLEDISISRDAKRLPWGIPVPDDESQTMYVWFDALTNYISTLGWPEDAEGNFKKFWEDADQVVQMAGKDQMRFQSVIWQAMLKSADIKATDTVFYHGFINSGGKKMSKTLGNVIDPYELVEKYGTDATRYMLLRHVHPSEDTDVTRERLDEWYTANLVNGLGNLVARVMKLSEAHDVKTTFTLSNSLQNRIDESLSAFQFNDALGHIWQSIQAADRRITEEEPFKVIKTDAEKGKAILQVLVQELFEIGRALEPFMPETSTKVLKAVELNKKPENLFPRLG